MKPTYLFFFLLLPLPVSIAWAEQNSDIVFGMGADEKLVLDAFTPEGEGPFPCCILVHGGGWMKGDKVNNFKTLFDPLSKAGFAWFSINYRLAPKHRYPACLEDVETAIRWVKDHALDYKIDKERIALIGESAGGHLVSLVAVRPKTDTRVAAVVSFYAPHDLERFAQSRLRTPAWAEALFGITEINEDANRVLREASPITYVNPGLPPFLLIHGTKDDKVLPEQSLAFQQQMRAAGNRCDVMLVENVSHGMVTWQKAKTSYKEDLVAWLKKTLVASP